MRRFRWFLTAFARFVTRGRIVGRQALTMPTQISTMDQMSAGASRSGISWISHVDCVRKENASET